MRHLLASAALLALSPIALASPLAAQEGAAMTDETAKQDLTFERVFASPSLNGPSPRGAKLSPDGRYLTLLRNREDDKDRYDLWGFDRETGEAVYETENLDLSPLPYIVVIIDEMADLMMVSKKEVEATITRLAQKPRADERRHDEKGYKDLGGHATAPLR